MQAFLTMAANRAVDDYAINTCGISGEQLMQNAGDRVVEQMSSNGYLHDSPSILILAGHGNNGGDGYVIAAGLNQLDLDVSIITTTAPDKLVGDARTHYSKLSGLVIPTQEWKDLPEQHAQIEAAGVIVDALLGTGIKGEIREPYGSLIKRTNQSPAKVVAVDVPSGVYGDAGNILEPCIRAELTVSMGFGKQGCLFEPARSHAGKMISVDIGFPTDSLDHIKDEVLWQNSDDDYPKSKFYRHADTHKYTAGKVFILAGSKGFSGAAILSSKAALRAGAGLVRLGIPESLGLIAESSSLETVVDYLSETSDMGIAKSAWTDIENAYEWADTLVVGPGLGRHPETIDVVRRLVKACQKPLVLDADALFALNDDTSILKSRIAPTILTPHIGEFKRLLKRGTDSHPNWQDAQQFATTHGVYLLLKGAPSLMAEPSGNIIVNSSGYAGMATAGSGDVLSGVIAALWSQWVEAANVLDFAMYIHGKAAEFKKPEKGVLGLVAGDIVEALPNVLKEYGGLPN